MVARTSEPLCHGTAARHPRQPHDAVRHQGVPHREQTVPSQRPSLSAARQHGGLAPLGPHGRGRPARIRHHVVPRQCRAAAQRTRRQPAAVPPGSAAAPPAGPLRPIRTGRTVRMVLLPRHAGQRSELHRAVRPLAGSRRRTPFGLHLSSLQRNRRRRTRAGLECPEQTPAALSAAGDLGTRRAAPAQILVEHLRKRRHVLRPVRPADHDRRIRRQLSRRRRRTRRIRHHPRNPAALPRTQPHPCDAAQITGVFPRQDRRVLAPHRRGGSRTVPRGQQLGRRQPLVPRPKAAPSRSGIP